jgi:hypothetical protein
LEVKNPAYAGFLFATLATVEAGFGD